MEWGRARGGARGLSQPLSQCKHVLIEIRSSGYNSFVDVAARPPLSFSLHRSAPHHRSLSLGVLFGSSVVLALFLKRLASRDCGVPLVTRVCSLFDYALSVSRERGMSRFPVVSWNGAIPLLFKLEIMCNRIIIIIKENQLRSNAILTITIGFSTNFELNFSTETEK